MTCAGAGSDGRCRAVLVTPRAALGDRLARTLERSARIRLVAVYPDLTALHAAGRPGVEVLLLDGALARAATPAQLTALADATRLVLLLSRRSVPPDRARLALAHGLLFVAPAEVDADAALACALCGYCAVPRDVPAELRTLQTVCRARGLRPVEREVLHLLACGWGDRDIAGATGRSTAETRLAVRRILRRLGLSNRTQAAVFYIRAAPLLPHPEPDGAAAG
jgi:DNA-binding NarL/FixJ family response regulator